MKERLQKFLESESLTKAQFADTINMARAGISHIMAGRNNPSYEFILNVMNAFPSLNIEWLLSGSGPMYKGDEEQFGLQQQKPKRNRKVSRIIMFYDDGHFEEFENLL